MTTQIATRGRLAVSLPCHGAEQPTTMWLYLITFGKQHEELAKRKKGDLVVSGSPEPY